MFTQCHINYVHGNATLYSHHVPPGMPRCMFSEKYEKRNAFFMIIKCHYRLGGEFKFERMSWIKTNFLWMMYRCGWASKKNQERVLAITISREGFEEILANAYTREVL